MATFTLSTSQSELHPGNVAILTLTADSSFKDSVDLSGTTVNGSIFNITPGSVFLCNDDVKTAELQIQSVPVADTLTVTGTAGSVIRQVFINLLP